MDILKNREVNNTFIVALSSTIDTHNKGIRRSFVLANNLNMDKVDDLDYLTREANRILRKDVLPFLKANGVAYVDSVGYWAGAIQPNSILIEMDKEHALYYVDNHAEVLGQDSIIAFGPDCTYEIFDEPQDYCTKLEDGRWVRFNMDGEYYESPEFIDNFNEAVNKDFTIDDILDVALKVAKNIYHKKNWYHTNYTADDFEADSLDYLYKKYNEGYFDENNLAEIKPKVIGMLSNWFLRNTHNRELKRVKNKVNLDELADNTDDYSGGFHLPSNDPTPSEVYELELGKEILNNLVNSFSDVPYATRKHKYATLDEHPVLGKGASLSPQNLAKLFVYNKHNKDITQAYVKTDTQYYSHDSQASYVAKRAAEVGVELVKKIEELSEEDQQLLLNYIDTL